MAAGHCFTSLVACARAARAWAACLGSKFGFRASARSRCWREAVAVAERESDHAGMVVEGGFGRVQFERLVAGLFGFRVLLVLVEHPGKRVVLVDVAARLHFFVDHGEGVIEIAGVIGVGEGEIAIGGEAGGLVHALDDGKARGLFAGLFGLAGGLVQIFERGGVLGQRHGGLCFCVMLDGFGDPAGLRAEFAESGMRGVVSGEELEGALEGLAGLFDAADLQLHVAEIDQAPRDVFRRAAAGIDGHLHDLDGARGVAGDEAVVGGAVVTGHIGTELHHLLVGVGGGAVFAEFHEGVAQRAVVPRDLRERCG